MNAKESRANGLKPYGVMTSADGDGVARGPALTVSPWMGGGVNYWLLIVAIVLLIVIFGTPIVHRMLDKGMTGEGPGAGSPAQEAISRDQRGKISEKIVKESAPVAQSTEAVPPSETTLPESPEAPITEKVDQEMGGAPGPEDAASHAGTDETRRDASEAAVIRPEPEPDGVAQKKSSDEAVGTTDAATEAPSRKKAPEAPAPEAKPLETPEDTPTTTDQSILPDKGEASRPKVAVETGARDDAAPPDIREVIVEMGNVRDGPSIEADVKFRIQRGETVTVIEQQGNWCAIELADGRSGWAHHTLLSRTNRAAEKKEPADGTGVRREIRAIRPVITKGGHTGVIFELNGYYPPETRVLDGGHPRLVCDFLNTRISGKIPRSQEVENGYIERIRIGIHDEPKPKVRVVMDFTPGADYTVEQLFYKKENYYTLMVKPRE